MKKLIPFLLIFVIGCSNYDLNKRDKGALTGTAIGAGLGAIIGHKTGSTGAGIAIGSALGGISGGLMGNNLDSQDVELSKRDDLIDRQEQVIKENRLMIEELRRKGVDVRESDRGVIVNLPDVLFKFDSANLTSDALRAAKEISKVIKRYPARTISVEGHTDSIGTISYNKKLSENRASSVSNELVAEGVSRRRIRTYGYGESDPVASNSSESGRKRNRRVEVVIQNNSSTSKAGFGVNLN